ncbi:MAG TPA: heat-inducible transcriptional repressor HrcA [Solirubrobacteraceae bacterium]|jgi:heat-inducible transcriptional repressor|nr:heat-inducible transcriptional repressor HrcA [Solirubrobacteraceae bacterium]
MLTPRQEFLLRKVVEGYLQVGQPVASKAIAADPEVDYGPSTIRNELAVLEEHGLLAHPHTSAGRVPTDAGQRYVVDRLLASDAGATRPRPLELSLMRREVDEAMRVTTATLSQVTNLLAIVTAPPLDTATIRHIEVLSLQPEILMVVIITSSGAVSKRMFSFDTAVDPGLVAWAGEYLNEKLAGLGLGARMLHQRLADPTLGSSERAFIDELLPAFTNLADTAEETLYFEGAARLLSDQRRHEVAEINQLMEMLERRVTLLQVLRSALGEQGLYVRIGHENKTPALRSLAMVASGYGLPQRKLGAVSVIGPVRMDYARVITSVREAALQLSRFVEDVYDAG